MKKLIVIVSIFLATTCLADMPEELFKFTNTVDVTAFRNGSPDNYKFGITKDNERFRNGVNEYFKSGESYFIIQDWDAVDNSYCCAVTDQKTIYAVCIDGKIVIIKEIKP